MSHTVQFAPQALTQLDAIENYIMHASSPLTAAHYVDAVVTYCESLATFPQRGIRRDDLLPALRITNYRHSAAIAFVVDDEARSVSSIGVFYGGQDYETVLPDLPGS